MAWKILNIAKSILLLQYRKRRLRNNLGKIGIRIKLKHWVWNIFYAKNTFYMPKNFHQIIFCEIIKKTFILVFIFSQVAFSIDQTVRNKILFNFFFSYKNSSSRIKGINSVALLKASFFLFVTIFLSNLFSLNS